MACSYLPRLALKWRLRKTEHIWLASRPETVPNGLMRSLKCTWSSRLGPQRRWIRPTSARKRQAAVTPQNASRCRATHMHISNTWLLLLSLIIIVIYLQQMRSQLSSNIVQRSCSTCMTPSLTQTCTEWHDAVWLLCDIRAKWRCCFLYW